MVATESGEAWDTAVSVVGREPYVEVRLGLGRVAAYSPAVRSVRLGRNAWSVLLASLVSLLLFGGLTAGLVNRNLVDGPRFAGHVDSLRRDPAVARQIGQAITARLLDAVPDLAAVRPLLETTAVSLAASPSFSPVIRAAARQLHGAFTEENPRQVALRLADVGAVLAGVLRVIAPQVSERIPSNLDVTLAQVGSGSFALDTIRLARLVGLLAWLLPGLALWPYLLRCRKERGQIPNYVAVNFFRDGDLFRAIDQLNGVG